VGKSIIKIGKKWTGGWGKLWTSQIDKLRGASERGDRITNPRREGGVLRGNSFLYISKKTDKKEMFSVTREKRPLSLRRTPKIERKADEEGKKMRPRIKRKEKGF